MVEIGGSPRSAWSGLLEPGPSGAPGAPGLVVAPQDGLGLAGLMVAPGGEAPLAGVVSERLGAGLPAGPGFLEGRDCLVLWSGPRHWLVVHERPDRLADALPAIAEVAAVTDQSGARGVLRLSGPRVRDVLAKGVPIDLDPSVFRPGDAAATLVAHVGVQIWQRDAAPTYELSVPRSQAGAIATWLAASAAEYGMIVADPTRTAR